MSSLNIVSNFAAQVAQRNLASSNSMASGSIAKLSSGSRVLGARDDAAALAIGSRLRAEVASQQQASVNAGQAVSMLQIADGAMSQINDTLVRMQSLAVQAGSDQLGSVERGLVNTEFQQLLQEVERIAQDTEFNGQSLINGGTLSQLVQAADAGTNGISSISFDSSVQNEEVFQYSYNATGEILTVTKLAVDGQTTNTATDLVTNEQATNNVSFTLAEGANADDVFTYSYVGGSTHQLTVTNARTGENAMIDITDQFNGAFGSGVDVIPTGQTLAVDFASLGVTVTLDDNFDRTNAIANSVGATLFDNSAGNDFTGGATISATLNTSGLTSTALATIAGLGTADPTVAYDASNGQLTIGLTSTNNDVIAIDTNATTAGFAISNTTADGTSQNFNLTLNGVTVATVTHTIDAIAAGDDDFSFTLDFQSLVRNVQTNTSGSDETVNIDLTNSIDAVAGTGQNLSFDETVDVAIDQFGVSLTLDKGFDRTTSISTTTGAVTESSAAISSASFATNSGFLDADVYDALLNLGYDATTGVGYNANTGILSLQLEDVGTAVRINGLAGISYANGVAGENSANISNGANTTNLAVTLADGSKVSLGDLTGTYADGGSTGDQSLVNIQLGAGVFYNSVDQNALTNDFTFKIGTGNESFDRITLSLNSVNQQALGINGLDVTTSANADAASTAISNSITTLNTARANVGAFQNRLDIAASNLATTTENTEAARSALLDLNVAQEMTAFTSNQILVQAGVSMLSQANQLPQNLLRLLQ